MRKIKIPWTQLEHILKKNDKIFPEEEIVGITLVKPKELHISIKKEGE